MNTYHIHIEGRVQGVGFRPFVWRLAKEQNLNGWVSNGKDGVHIEVSGHPAACSRFYQALTTQAPHKAQIVHQSIRRTGGTDHDHFSILESLSTGATDIVITPDLGLCESCRQEIRDPHNRRFQYPFTTCTHCGPRYSIQTAVPFDRAHTTLQAFTPCAACSHEYTTPQDIRFYSQTNSCPACGIRLTAHDVHGYALSSDVQVIISLLAEQLAQGNIVALKNIGGFLLLCDATREKTIALLRQRKQRGSKPLAVLYPSLAAILEDAVVSKAEENALLSPEAPIVLVKGRPHPSIAMGTIAPAMRQIGAMLPYSPLMVMIMDRIGKPVVATSANVSGAPIHFREKDAFEALCPIADFFVTHNCDIVVPQDDSVARFTATGRRILLRRSRGYAPAYTNRAQLTLEEHTLAMGADLKSTFAVTDGHNIHVSQYLADLSNFDAQQNFTHTLDYMLRLLQINPTQVLADLHPGYHSTLLAQHTAARFNAKLWYIQHHEAHFAAVLGEHGLLHTQEPVLGVVFDGAGFGTDGQVWGGEYFLFETMEIRRIGHVDYFDCVLGDKFAREPRLAALSLIRRHEQAQSILEKKFTAHELSVYGQTLEQPQLLKTSSVARLFDAVASLLDLCDRSSYEGEAAMLLETLASTATPDETASARVFGDDSTQSPQKMVGCVLDALAACVPKHLIAYQFHLTLVSWIAAIAGQARVRKIAFSGGVFQNALLTHLLEQQLAERYTLYFHDQLSPNDECISFGQLARHAMDKSLAHKNTTVTLNQK